MHANAASRGLKKMAEVLVTIKIMPRDADIDMDALAGRIGEVDGARLNGVEKEPIAFGLVALIASYVVEDKEGGTENLESALKEIKDIGNIEVTGATRLL
jgi:elongation factor 1-beta